MGAFSPFHCQFNGNMRFEITKIGGTMGTLLAEKNALEGENRPKWLANGISFAALFMHFTCFGNDVIHGCKSTSNVEDISQVWTYPCLDDS